MVRSDVRGYRKCLFDLIDEVAGHDLYKFSSSKTPKLELKQGKVTGDELRSKPEPARSQRLERVEEEQNELVERI